MDHNEQLVINKITAWARDRLDVRLVLWTSSRAKRFADPQAVLSDQIDALSDYDIVLVVDDIQPYFDSRTWLSHFGEVLALYRDPICERFGGRSTCLVTQYPVGLKIDFSIWSVEVLDGILQSDTLPDDLDVGYAVLLDKEGLAAGLKPPTYRAYIPAKPTFEEYRTEVELFFHEATYAAKHLWRQELIPAKEILDGDMKANHLRQVLEWLVEIDHGWALKTGAHGRYLQSRLPPEVWCAVEAAYAGAALAENWAALFRLVELYRNAAVRVGAALGYEYPYEMDRRMLEYLEWVRRLPRS